MEQLPRQQAVCAQARLPAQMTATLGCEQKLAALVALLRQENAHLVTLTGSGGVGKTRLGLGAARAVQEHFADSVFFVSLAPLRGEWSGATAYYPRGLELATATKDRLGVISLLHGLGEAARTQGMDVLACTRLKQSLRLA